MMMGEEGVDGDLAPEEPRPVDEWPPPPTSAANLELTNKDGTSSRLLFLTVQYVGEESGTSFNTGLEGFTELEQRVVSPLDPNMGCTACLSPVYRPSSPLMSAPMSPTSSYLNPPSPTVGQEPGMIVLSEPCHYTSADNFVVASNSRMYSHAPLGEAVPAADDGKQLLLLSTDANNPAELIVAGDNACGDQRVELLLSNGTIAYGIVESTDDSGTRVIQIPREYLVTTGDEPNHLPSEEAHIRQVDSIQHDTVVPVHDDVQEDDGSHLRALYDTLKEQGLIIEPGQSNLDQQLIDPSLLNQTTMPVPILEPQPQEFTLPPQKRFWCEECNVLLEADCREHQVDRKITDKAVPSRARATLPAAYLSINTIPNTGNGKQEEGVFARKNIPKRTQFGPIEGLIVKPDEIIISDTPRLELTIETQSGEMKTLDVSNEHMSNWMRFVRVATSEQPPNLLLSQLGASLFFTTTHMIPGRQELLVWYSPAYASRRGLPVRPPPPEWPCSTCGTKCKNAAELTAHSDCHINNPISLPVVALDNISLPLFDTL